MRIGSGGHYDENLIARGGCDKSSTYVSGPMAFPGTHLFQARSIQKSKNHLFVSIRKWAEMSQFVLLFFNNIC